MPGLDRTGPMGAGPMTGRGLGLCTGGRGYYGRTPRFGVGRGGFPWGGGRGRAWGGGRGWGVGRGWGGGQGRGRGWWSFGGGQFPHPYWGYGGPYPYGAPYEGAPSSADERAFLEQEMADLQAEMDEIRARMKELSKSKKEAE
ncbi:hypothetical protein AMJ39_04070 [candidate division TA06 bacterium DG_24]|uniref:DUF5320 domain-containing protein n=1 Tax=candidate division TA06 bacterium DG_24 TaxID=1703770 RepID=A0A0S7WTS2_UNCT6|nr:MAG: hypothetical protein AMJ39_04070 [candidate division TA06 bacterium DG_24]